MRSGAYELTTYLWDPRQASELPSHPRAVALGIFDGVHLGHRAVISQATGVDIPREGHAVSTVFTFLQPPWALTKDSAWELMSDEQKMTVFKGLGVEEWIRADFEAVRDLTPEEFVHDFLHKALNARRVCCGFNYHFGKHGKGTADQLRQLCEPLGIEVVVASPVTANGQPVSASRIRRLIEEGEVEQASRLLGRPFTIDFPVVGGQKLGRLLGAPTINQPLPPHFVRPRFGVYATSIEVNGRVRHGVTNVGVRPTINPTEPLAETWIADFEGDLYGKRVPVSLIRFLRPEMKFHSIEELQEQILRDAELARQAVQGDEGSIKAVLFDFDDTLQNRTIAFMQFCDFFFDKYFPDLPADVTEARKQDMFRRNNGGYVNYLDYFLSLFEDWGWTDAPPVGDVYREFQFRFPEYVSLFPEAVGVLKELKRRGYLIGIITNGPSLLQNRKLDVSGLRPLLDVTVVSGDEKVHKPDAEIFRRAAARLGVSCQSCVYVGDHPLNDVQGAKGAGMRPIYINAYGSDIHIDGVTEITNLQELLHVL